MLSVCGRDRYQKSKSYKKPEGSGARVDSLGHTVGGSLFVDGCLKTRMMAWGVSACSCFGYIIWEASDARRIPLRECSKIREKVQLAQGGTMYWTVCLKC